MNERVFYGGLAGVLVGIVLFMFAAAIVKFGYAFLIPMGLLGFSFIVGCGVAYVVNRVDSDANR